MLEKRQDCKLLNSAPYNYDKEKIEAGLQIENSNRFVCFSVYTGFWGGKIIGFWYFWVCFPPLIQTENKARILKQCEPTPECVDNIISKTNYQHIYPFKSVVNKQFLSLIINLNLIYLSASTRFNMTLRNFLNISSG